MTIRPSLGDRNNITPDRATPELPQVARGRVAERANLSLGLWDQLVPVQSPHTMMGSQHSSSTANTQRSLSPVPRQALLAKGTSTIGLSVYGTQIDYLVPGGPAHLTQQLDKDDEIISVDGVNVDLGNVVGCLQGTDVPGSRVRLSVRKQSTGQLVKVELVYFFPTNSPTCTH